MSKSRRQAVEDLWWYRLQCFARSPQARLLRRMLEASGREDLADAQAIGDLKQKIRTAPVWPVQSDGSTWVTLKIDLRLPPKFILPYVEYLLHDLRQNPVTVFDLSRNPIQQAILESLKPGTPINPYESLGRPTPKHRIHIRKLKLALTVWDLCEMHKDYRKVAAEVGKPISTVRDLYRQAAGDILQIHPDLLKHRWREVASDGARRKREPPPAFNFHEHLRSCPKCSTTPDSDRWCKTMRTAAFPEEFAQREKTLRDPSEVERINRDPLAGEVEEECAVGQGRREGGKRVRLHKRTK
jgi:hypothetical protein